MITTIEKAKTKCCVFRLDGCVGPECMAWEFWVPPPEVKTFVRPKHGKADEDKLGYCGLTGKKVL